MSSTPDSNETAVSSGAEQTVVSSPSSPSSPSTTATTSGQEVSLGSSKSAAEQGNEPGGGKKANKKAVIRDGKILVRFRAAGAAPILKQNKFRISAAENFGAITAFLRKQLKLPSSASLFVYCNSAFSPAPDEPLAALAACFHVEGTLNVHYSTTPAWG